MFAMVLGFVPFIIMVSDAAFPETETIIRTGGCRNVLTCTGNSLISFSAGGKIISLLRNSWSRHLSLTYNQKYEYVLRVTWVGYEFFGTLALGIYLLKVILVMSIQEQLFKFRVKLWRRDIWLSLFWPWKVSRSLCYWHWQWFTGILPLEVRLWNFSG